MRFKRISKQDLMRAALVGLVTYSVMTSMSLYLSRSALQIAQDSSTSIHTIREEMRLESYLDWLAALRREETDEVMYDLYTSVSSGLVDNQKIWTEVDREQFKNNYRTFMRKRCNQLADGACVQYGEALAELGRLDAAANAYRLAAENGHVAAQAKLGYLHANQEWSGYSPELSRRWLIKAADSR